MDIVLNYALNLYLYTHRLVLLLDIIREVSLCGGSWSTQKLVKRKEKVYMEYSFIRGKCLDWQKVSKQQRSRRTSLRQSLVVMQEKSIYEFTLAMASYL